MTFLFKTALAASLFGAGAFALPADARPVSYPGGWTVMQFNNGDYSSFHGHYSPTYQDSVGLYVEQNWDGDFTFTGLQYNRLVKRWNGKGEQANVYFKAAAGQADPFGEGSAKLGGMVGLSADWETRRYFLSAETRALDLGFDKSVRSEARIGIAPYIGDFGDLHTWLMLEVGNQPEAEDPTSVTPLIRFFKGVNLVEIGYTPQSEEFMFNWIVRF